MCGGGSTPYPSPTGSGGYNSFEIIQPAWSDQSEALAKSAKSGYGFLVALQRQKKPIGIWDTQLADASKTMPFVRIEDADAEAFARKWGIATLPAVVTCDRFGNVLDTVDGNITAVKVKAALAKMPSTAQSTESLLTRGLTKARSLAEAGKVQDALSAIASISRFTGYDACDGAEQLRQSLLEQGFRQVAEAKEIATSDSSSCRSKLTELKRAYRGTGVADEAGAALKTLH
jgi:hypothetical protein